MKDMPISKKIGLSLVFIQLIATVVFIGSLMKLGMLPDLYLIIITAAVCVPLLIIAIIQLKTKKKGIISKLISIIFSVVLLLLSFYLFLKVRNYYVLNQI